MRFIQLAFICKLARDIFFSALVDSNWGVGL